MFARDYICPEIFTLSPNTQLIEAIAIMDEQKLLHLPVVDENRFCGLLFEGAAFDQESFEQSICLYPDILKNKFAFDYQPIYEVAKIACLEKLDIVPILNKDEQYMGSISQTKLFETIAELTAIAAEGEILFLKMQMNDLFLSEITRLSEENGCRIISLSISPIPHSSQIYLILKVTAKNLNKFVSTLERYNYDVEIPFQTEFPEDSLSDNYKLLMKFLDI